MKKARNTGFRAFGVARAKAVTPPPLLSEARAEDALTC